VRQKFKARKKIHLIRQNILDCICLLGSPFGIPGIRTLYKGLVLHPRKWIWICFGAAGILCMVLFHILATIELAAGSILLWATMILSTIYNFHINREFVLKYNVMVDAGYFEQQARRKEANQNRMNQTYEHQAQDSMKNAMQMEKRIEASAQIKRPDHPQQIMAKENSSAEKYIPAAPSETPKPVKAAKATEPAKIVEPIKNDPAHGKRKLDL